MHPIRVNSVATNWLLFVLTAGAAFLNINYFITLTSGELDKVTASAMSISVTASKMQNTKNTAQAGKVHPGAILKTNYGEIEIDFRDNEAPKAIANFKKLAENGFYSGTKFHRVIAGFMIQGGDPVSKDNSQKNLWGTGGPGYSFADELYADDVMSQGVIAMANSGPNTNGSQFFIVTASQGTPWLVGHHTIFGYVVRGMDVVLKIERVGTEGKGVYDRPAKDVVLESVTIK